MARISLPNDPKRGITKASFYISPYSEAYELHKKPDNPVKKRKAKRK